jgi:hypothetical protein
LPDLRQDWLYQPVKKYQKFNRFGNQATRPLYEWVLRLSVARLTPGLAFIITVKNSLRFSSI